MELLITDRLHKGCIIGGQSPRLISMRKLSAREIAFARKTTIRRYYLPNLNEYESEEFFKEFDKFWDQVIKPFGTDHPFWRNVVSSKMQEWERSCAYLALILFTLAQKSAKESLCIVFVCSSLEEEDVCEEWGKKMGWKVYRRPYLSLPQWVRRIVQEIENLKNFLKMTSICLYKKWFSPIYKSEALLSNKQILINSLFYLNSFKNGKYIDPFFGNIHEIIKEKGYSVTYLCKPLDNFKESVKKTMEHREVSILLPYSLVPWRELIFLVFKAFLSRFEIRQSFFRGCDFSTLIKWKARCFDYYFNFDSEIYYAAVSNLCEKKNIYRLIQLYEGNVFERSSIQAFKQKCSGTTVGYSHGVIYPINLKMRLTDYERSLRPEPDIFICTGSYSCELLHRLGNRHIDKLKASYFPREIPIIKIIKTTNNGDILIATEGQESSIVMLDFVFENSTIYSNRKIILRGHPNVPIVNLVRSCIYLKPNSFEISNRSLHDDLQRSCCVIYRQTSIGMQALLNGMPVIYLNINSPLSSDPLFEYRGRGRWIVSTPEELKLALKQIELLSVRDKEEIQYEASSFIHKYFTPASIEGINEIIHSNCLL